MTTIYEPDTCKCIIQIDTDDFGVVLSTTFIKKCKLHNSPDDTLSHNKNNAIKNSIEKENLKKST